jgi:dipeptidase D
MTKDSIEIYRDGDFLKARGTSLGGDDGVAVAYALAILDSNDIEHPAIEALFTSDEEIGLLGAAAFDTSRLQGKTLVNLDSDEEGIFTVGCAGGVRTDCNLKVERECFEAKKYAITVGGLLGGHSGAEIHTGRGNAIKLLGEILAELGDIRIADIFGGSADNAIPREATAYIATNADIATVISEKDNELGARYAGIDDGVKVTAEPIAFDAIPLTKDSTNAVIALISAIKTGVMAMSGDIEGLVESSENIGIIKLSENTLKLTTSVRSSVDAEKEKLASAIKASAENIGAAFSTRGDYPGWAFKKDSHLRDICCAVYRELYGKDAKVVTIHAGLECGIFSGKIEGLDCVSLGPNGYDIHTTEERLSISSTARVFDFLKAILAKI